MNEGIGTNVSDFSGLGYNCTKTNNVGWANGVVGRCGAFWGSVTDKCTLTTQLNLSSNFTYACWLVYTNISDFSPIVASSTGTPGLFINASSIPTLYAPSAMAALSPIPQGVWTHIVAVSSNGVSGIIYTNGVFENSGSIGISSINVLHLAGRPTGSAQYFKGLLDDVRIYNRALSADEVKQLYNGGYGCQ